MKIAVATEDGQNISSHFGMAPYYHVFSVENAQILDEEERQKAHHSSHPQHDSHEQGHGGLHEDMFASIRDCSVLLCGGMGEPAYQKAQSLGLEVILVGGEIRPAVEAYAKSGLQSDPRRIHHR